MIQRFFLENKESIEELVKPLALFSSFLGLNLNISKPNGSTKRGGNGSLRYPIN